MKYINFKRYKFSTIAKNLNTLIFNFLKIFNFAYFKRFDPRRIYKYLYIRKPDFSKITKYFSPRAYIGHIQKIKFTNNKFLLIHLPLFIIFFSFLYLVIPTFYNYDRSDIEEAICKKQNIQCLIKGKINYSFYPTPRIKIKNLAIKDFVKKKDNMIKIEEVAIKISIKNLLVKEKHKFEKILLNNYEINLNLNNWKSYKNIFFKEINFLPVTFKKGKIIFFEGSDYIATINKANLDLKFMENSLDAVLKGEFLDKRINVSLNREKDDNKTFSEFVLNMPSLGLLTKVKFSDSEKDKDAVSGSILLKKDKNKITSLFDYKNSKLKINKSNLRNAFIDGKLEGEISFLPFFNFDLDVSLNSINFTKLYSYFLSLNENEKKKIFKINNKINGKLILSADKIYSSYNLIKSFESQLIFKNGNILVDQFLINLGKLGAADILGMISNEKKFSQLKFESNIFVDNQKKFLSKFGIYNKKAISSNLFVSGNFNFDNKSISFYEISDNEKLNNQDVNFIEKEFNDIMLGENYEILFQFPKLKEFIKSIISETN